jgi:hypothetical protein
MINTRDKSCSRCAGQAKRSLVIVSVLREAISPDGVEIATPGLPAY